jgi:transcriptional regulator with XRE-family HTH domain
MTAKELRQALSELGLTQAEFALLVGVTARAVALWVNDERAVPGPASAYLRLFGTLPKHLQARERASLQQEDIQMEGMYRLELKGKAGSTVALLVIGKHSVFGSDEGGVMYDGEWEANPTSPSEATLRLKVTVPSNVELIMGKPAVFYERRFDVEVTIEAKTASKEQIIKTPDGDLRGTISFVREIPADIAA